MKTSISMFLFLFFAATHISNAAGTLSIYGLPMRVAKGDTLQLTANYGTPAYLWSSSNPAVGYVGFSSGQFIALDTGVVMITVTDNSTQSTSLMVKITDLKASVPNISFHAKDSIDYPVFISSLTGYSIYSAELRFVYDPSKLTFLSTQTFGTLTQGTTVSTNVISDTIRIGIASGSPISGALSEFITLRFQAKDTLQYNVTIPIRFMDIVFDEPGPGVPTVAPYDGSLTILPPINTPPIFTNTFSENTISEGDFFSFPFHAIDAEGDTLSFSINGGYLGPEMEIDSSGFFQWSPMFERQGDHLLEVVADDHHGGITSFPFTMHVLNTNRNPYFDSTTLSLVSLKEGEHFSYTFIAKDFDGEIPTYHIGSPFPGMTIDTITGTVDWTPGFTSANEYSLQISAVDGAGGFVTYSMTILVSDSNAAPVISIAPKDTIITEGQLLYLPFYAFDPDLYSVTYSLQSAPSGFQIDSMSGNMFWATTSNDAGLYTIIVRAQDQEGAFSLDSFQISVNNLNQSPVIYSHPDTLFVFESGTVYSDIDGSDYDGDPVIFSLMDQPLGMVIDSITGLISWTPDYTQSGTYMFTVMLADTLGAVDIDTLYAYVYNSNQNPFFTKVPPDTVFISEGQNFSYTVDAIDPDSNGIWFQVQTNEGVTLKQKVTLKNGDQLPMFGSNPPFGMSIDSLSGFLQWTPEFNQAGSYDVVLLAHDTVGGTDFKMITFIVMDSNRAPVFTNAIIDTTIYEGQYLSYSFNAVDPEFGPVQYHLMNGIPSPEMDFDTLSGFFNWTPDFTRAGDYVFEIQAADTGKYFTSHYFTVHVLNFDQPPVIQSVFPDTVFIKEGNLFSQTIIAADADLDEIRFSLSSFPAGMTIDSVSGLLMWTPEFSQSGDHYAHIGATANGATVNKMVFFVVIDSNRIPVITHLPADSTMYEGDVYTSYVQAEDPDFDPIRYYVISAPPPTFTVDSLTGSIAFTPNTAMAGTYNIGLRISDGYWVVDTFYTLTVLNVNQKPMFLKDFPDTVYAAENDQILFDYDANDLDGDSLQFVLYNEPSGMTIDMSTGIITWIPDFTQAGEYLFEVKVFDPSFTYAIDTVRLFVLNTNRPPYFINRLPGTVFMMEGDSINFNYTFDDPDAEDSLHTVLLTNYPGMSLSADGNFHWQPSYSQSGTYTVAIDLCDGTMSTFDTTVIVVMNRNLSPFFVDALPDTAIIRSDTLRFQYSVIDPDSNELSMSIVSAPPGASLALSGELEWAPPVFANGTFPFIVRVDDGSGSVFDTAWVRINIYGDVSGNGGVSPFDASLVLQSMVSAITLSPLQNNAADVSDDSTVSPFDASLILQYSVGLISAWPTGLHKTELSTEAYSAFSFHTVKGQKQNEYELVVSVNKPMPVYGITFSLGFDTSLVAARSMKNSALTDSMSMSSFFPNGKANVAFAGTRPLSATGEIARFLFTVKDPSRTADAKFTIHKFVLNEIDFSKEVGSIPLNVKDIGEIPTAFGLQQNFPNPFNPTTTIQYQLPKTSIVTVTIYNMIGQVVKSLVNGAQEAGYYTAQWNGTDNNNHTVASGVYVYRIHAVSGQKENFVSTKKMLLVK